MMISAVWKLQTIKYGAAALVNNIFMLDRMQFQGKVHISSGSLVKASGRKKGQETITT